MVVDVRNILTLIVEGTV